MSGLSVAVTSRLVYRRVFRPLSGGDYFDIEQKGRGWIIVLAIGVYLAATGVILLIASQ